MFNKHCLLKILNHLHQWFHPGDVAASSVVMLWRWMERPLSTSVCVCVWVLKAHANSSNEINYLYTQWNVRLWSVRAHVRNSFDLCLDIILFLSLSHSPFSIWLFAISLIDSRATIYASRTVSKCFPPHGNIFMQISNMTFRSFSRQIPFGALNSNQNFSHAMYYSVFFLFLFVFHL